MNRKNKIVFRYLDNSHHSSSIQCDRMNEIFAQRASGYVDKRKMFEIMFLLIFLSFYCLCFRLIWVPVGRWTVLKLGIFRFLLEHSTMLWNTLQFNIYLNFLGQTLIKLFTQHACVFIQCWFRLSKYRSSSLCRQRNANR